MKNKPNLKKIHQNPSIAYTMPLPFGLTLNAKKSANAWWMDQQKVHSLISVLRLGITIEEACSYTGISVKQYKYFAQEHPEFKEARHGFVLETNIRAQMTIMKSIHAGDIKTCWKWLEKHSPEEFGKPSSRKRRHVTEKEIEDLKNRGAQNMYDQMSQEEKDILEQLRIARRKRIRGETN